MRVLLIGEYSNVHWTLAEGLRTLGHEVTVVSNGDFWKNYPRDIDLVRRDGCLGGLQYFLKLMTILPCLCGYDVVQLINPMFFELKAERLFSIYRYLRRNNKKLFLGGFGMDYYWVHENITRMPLRYSDFNIGTTLRTDADAIKERKDWIGTEKERLNKMIANDCDGIITGLYEYQVCYEPYFRQKTRFIPYPIKMENECGLCVRSHTRTDGDKIKLFIGISKKRSTYKGTDIMLRAAEDIVRRYPNEVTLKVVNGLPFDEYKQEMLNADVILDQLYSYTPSMNPLEAMSHGIVCVGGGEPENYEILGEKELRPIINVLPTYDSVYEQLEQLVLNPSILSLLQEQSIAYIRRHHDYIKVAKVYVDFWTKQSV